MLRGMAINPHALKAIRVKDGQSMSGLSRASGVSVSMINDIEKGRRGAGPDTIKALARALNVPMSAIETPSERSA